MEQFSLSALDHPIMNAAGICKSIADVDIFANQSFTSAIVIGSYTIEPRDGNQEPNYYEHFNEGVFEYTLNTLGLPNFGLPGMSICIPEMRKIAHAANKHLLVSVAGFHPQHYYTLARAALTLGADGIEINVGCPNVWNKNKPEKMISYDPGLLFDVLYAVERALSDSRLPWWVKLSPYTQLDDMRNAASVINSSNAHGITLTNTLGNCTMIHPKTGTPVTEPNLGLAGLGGRSIKPISLANVLQFHRLLLPDKFIIGCGGIMNGQDVLDYMRAGASAVQIASARLVYGHKIFYKIATHYAELISQ